MSSIECTAQVIDRGRHASCSQASMGCARYERGVGTAARPGRDDDKAGVTGFISGRCMSSMLVRYERRN